MKFKLSVIQSNPYRHLESYPIKADKVAALAASIEQTGFWDNVVARLRPDGKPEIAYGHHRLEAAKKALGSNSVVDLIIKDLDDETMIKVMANENMTEWGTSAIVEQETVRAVVEAFAAGEIRLTKPGRGSHVIRIAPYFRSYQIVGRSRGVLDGISGYDPEMTYTETTVARFLGWIYPGGQVADRKVTNALDALALIEEDILDIADFTNLGTHQAEVVVEQTKKRRKASTGESPTQKKRAASRVGKSVANGLRSGELSTREAKHAAETDIALTHGQTLNKRKVAEGVSHPAPFNDAILDTISELLVGYRRVLDPFAGTGRIHELTRHDTVGIELEPEWANCHPKTQIGNALALPFADHSFDAIATSPCYGNRLADHHDASDPEARRSYTHDLGRKLSPGSSGEMQWGIEYRDFHEQAWKEALRVLRPTGRFVLNIKDHIRKSKWVDVVGWHLGTLSDLGLYPVAVRCVSAPGLFAGRRPEPIPVELVIALDRYKS